MKPKQDVVKGQQKAQQTAKTGSLKTTQSSGPLKTAQSSAQVKAKNDEKKTVTEVWLQCTL